MCLQVKKLLNDNDWSLKSRPAAHHRNQNLPVAGTSSSLRPDVLDGVSCDVSSPHETLFYKRKTSVLLLKRLLLNLMLRLSEAICVYWFGNVEY